MTKKRKHYETCPHCAFVHAFMLKYPTAKKRDKGFDDLVQSAIKVAALTMRAMEPDGQKEFLRQALEKTLGASIVAEVISRMEQAKEPTKH